MLIVDDDAANRKVVGTILNGAGYEVNEASDAFAALDRIDLGTPHAVLLDLKMPGMDGLALLENLRQRGVVVPVVVLTGHGDEFTAARCLEAGADAFLDKPPERAALLLAIKNAVTRGRLTEENRVLKARGEEPPLLGESPEMQSLREGIARVAPSRATVLVFGESGTGKELVARRIHHLSPRARAEFVRVNCAAIPEELIESELFGHEKGSFTGAIRKQLGKFVQADGGTIFLDEVGDMSLRTQAKVLRVLQDGEVEPVGAGQVRHVDVRVIAATNKDLRTAVTEGRFREDLFYRLNVVALKMPPLRERPEDILPLAEVFMAGRGKAISAKARQRLLSYGWPGNVRELKNCLERAMILGSGDAIQPEDLPPCFRSGKDGIPAPPASLADQEKKHVERTLREAGWSKSETARILGITRQTLDNKIRKYRIKRPASGRPG